MNSLPPNRRGDSPEEPRKGLGRKINPLRSWRAHADIGITVFLIILVLGLPVAWLKGKPKYLAQAVVLVWPRFLKNLEDDKEFDIQSNSQYREFVEQHVRTVNRYDIIEESISRLEKTDHPFRRPKETLQRAVGRLQGQLAVGSVPDTYQITMTLEGAKPSGLAETVNTVAAVFLEKCKEEEFYGRDQRLASLRQEAETVAANLAADAEEKDRLAQQLGVSVFTESMINPFDHLLVGSKEALATARQKRIIAEADLGALQTKRVQEESALHAYAVELTEKNSDLVALQSNLNLRKSELMAKLEGMLPEHPGRAALEKEMQDIDLLLKSKSDGLSQEYSAMLLAQHRAETAAAITAEEGLQKEVALQAAQAAWYSGNYQKGINLKSEMERERKRLESIQDRIEFILQEAHAPGFARPFSPAREPSDPIVGGRKKLFLMIGMLGGLLGLALPLALDFLDPRVLSPEEPERYIGFAPLGFTFDGLGPEFAQRQLQRIAVALERDILRNGSRSFLFVPVNHASDAASLAAALAQRVADLGHQVRLVNSRCPPSISSQRGDSNNGCTGDASCGNDNGHVSSTRTLLTRVKTESEVALVTAAPLSESADTELLASTCDVVVLTFEAEKTTKKELLAATRLLERIQPTAVSMVVTGYDPDPPLPDINLSPTILKPLLARLRSRAEKTVEAK